VLALHQEITQCLLNLREQNGCDTYYTNDPRASTLKALAIFFDISIDELLNGINVMQPYNNTSNTQAIAAISWTDCIHANDFLKTLTPANWNHWVVTEFISNSAYALISKPSMEPRFPKGTILVIDPTVLAEDGRIVIVHYPNTDEATLRELSVDGPTKLLLPINANLTITPLQHDIKILGVLVKSIFSFQQ
jgi:SOS-response transcriptional repressor LexA